MNRLMLVAASSIAIVACNGNSVAQSDAGTAETEAQLTPVDPEPFETEVIGDFDEPWAMAFLPDGRLIVTEKPGTMKVLEFGGDTPRLGTISGIPAVAYGGQGGLGDVRPHPDFAENNLLYFSYAEPGEGATRGAAVARGELVCGDAAACSLENVEVIWRQEPKTTGRGHYGHRILFGPDGYLWISSGDRQKLDPAQDLSDTLGTVIRLNDDGSVPDDNPFADRGGVSAQIWSYGHRNPLGFDFDPAGQLWVLEHGPAGGDELNRIARGANYGWPVRSDGEHYDGEPIPDHEDGGEFTAPVLGWTPVIAPGNMIFYTGDMFADWAGDAIVSGLETEALIRVEMDGEPREAARYDMGARIRAVVQGPDGALWVLEDEREGSDGRLLRLTRP